MLRRFTVVPQRWWVLPQFLSEIFKWNIYIYIQRFSLRITEIKVDMSYEIEVCANSPNSQKCEGRRRSVRPVSIRNSSKQAGAVKTEVQGNTWSRGDDWVNVPELKDAQRTGVTFLGVYEHISPECGIWITKWNKNGASSPVLVDIIWFLGDLSKTKHEEERFIRWRRHHPSPASGPPCSWVLDLRTCRRISTTGPSILRPLDSH